MKPFSLLLLPGLIAAAYAATPPTIDLVQEEVVAEATADISAQVDKIIAEYDVTYKAWLEEYNAAEGDAKRALRGKIPSPLDAGEAIMALVSDHPAADGALDGCLWVCSSVRRGKPMDQALTAMASHYAGHADIVETLSRMRGSSDAHIALWEAVLEQNKAEEARAFSCYNLANALASKLGDLDAGTDAATALETRIVGLYGRAQDEFGDVVLYKRRGGTEVTVGAKARGALFELNNLRVGKTAPDISAEDVAGSAFKLSDYRGKVVMLDFWGDW